MIRNKQYSARQDSETGEWFFNGKWHDHYPYQEVKDHNEAYDRHMERKLDEMREGEDDSKAWLFGGDR